MGRVMQIAAFSLAEVTYAVGGDIGYQIQESVKTARFRIKTKQENVSGVYLPQFEGLTKDEINDFGLTGLGKGGQQVQKCRETYTRAVETLVELASLQTAFMILDEVIKVVNRRGKIPSAVFKSELTSRQSTRLNMSLSHEPKTPLNVSSRTTSCLGFIGD
jgi:V-type H+-transporting ATPase subunit D